MAFTQLTTSAICLMAGLLTLGAECGIKITVDSFEELYAINTGGLPGYFYVSMKPCHRIITGFTSKVYNWDANYFFVKINEASVLNVREHYRTQWNSAVGV